MAELEQRPDPDRGISVWGAPFVLAQERVVEGHLTEEQWERIVPALRRLTGSTGTVNRIGRTREWTRTIKDMDYVVEQTQVSVKELTDWLQVAIARPDTLVDRAQSALEILELSPDQDSHHKPHLKQSLRT